jgi:hypothetical protein
MNNAINATAVFFVLFSTQVLSAGSFDDSVDIYDTNNSVTELTLNNGTTAPASNWFIANNAKGTNELTLGTFTDGTKFQLTIEHDAPQDSLYIDANGNMGIGTSNTFARLSLADTGIGSAISFGGSPFWIGGNSDTFDLVDFSAFDGNIETLNFPFRSSTGAPDNSLFINSSGQIGLGTTTPGGPLGSNLTVSNSGPGLAPASIFMNDGVNEWSFGAEPSVGAFIGNGLTAYLNITPTGNVGLSPGTFSPEAKLHVGGVNDAKILVKNTGNGNGTKIMYNLVNDGGIRFDMLDSSTGSNWVFQNQFGSFDVTLAGTGTREFRFYPNGNLELSGILIQASSREIKHNIESVDQVAVLAKVIDLPINSWSYNKQPGVTHIGPMAEDFYDSFGLGENPKGISSVDTGGVALAAIQGLKREKDTEINQLRSENIWLRTEIERLKEQQGERILQLEMALSELIHDKSGRVQVSSVN